MKKSDFKGLDTKELAERIDTEVAKLQNMKLNHAITPLENVRENLTNNNGPDGNKKFKKNKTGCRYQQQNG